MEQQKMKCASVYPGIVIPVFREVENLVMLHGRLKSAYRRDSFCHFLTLVDSHIGFRG